MQRTAISGTSADETTAADKYSRSGTVPRSMMRKAKKSSSTSTANLTAGDQLRLALDRYAHIFQRLREQTLRLRL